MKSEIASDRLCLICPKWALGLLLRPQLFSFFAHKKSDSSFGLVCNFFSRQKSNVESEKRRAEKLERDMAIAAEKADKAQREVSFFLKMLEFSANPSSCFENLGLGNLESMFW